MEDQIRAEFRKNNFVLVEEEDILQKCLTFCINYNLSPADLVSSWDLYSINRQLELIVSDAHMDAFRQQLESEQKQAIIEEQGLHSYIDVTMEINDEHEDAKEVVPTSPAAQNNVSLESFDVTPITNGKMHSLGKPLELVTPFGQRKDKFVVHSTLNTLPTVPEIKKEHGEENSDDDIIKRVQPIKRCSLEIHGSKPATGCRYMYDRIEDKFNHLEDRIMKYSEALVASQLYDELVDPSVASQKAIFTVGMICCEEEGRLKEKPIMLQSSVEHSGGQRVRLELQKLEQFSIFPGQVVGVEGHNPSGHRLIATKIVDYVPLSVPDDDSLRQTKRQAVDQDNQPADPSDISSDLSLIIASGPFTTTDNLFFEPLSDLLAYAQRKEPQLLVLLGPFIDFEHPEIKKGALNKTYDELFRIEVLKKLQDYVEYMGPAARVVLVPSVRDAHHDHVFPQPAFDINLADINHQITCITNPGIITANKVKVGCCSVDVLKQLSTDMVSRGIKNRMNTLTTHLLSQRSFYPLYPPAEDTPVDLSLAPEAFQMSVISDILIVPSDLTQFVKVLSPEGTSEVKCICVNPGRLARGEGGGHFVELNFHGGPDSSSASETETIIIIHVIIIIMRLMGETSMSGSTSTGDGDSSSSVLHMNYPLLAALLAFAIAQSIKVVTTWYKEKRWDLKQLLGSGGMPSSHSATVTALAVAVGFQDGIGGTTFAIALILACVVMYDATGVRLQAGRQAELLNQIVYELPAEHPLADTRPLRELLGHTPPQVAAGCLLGFVTAGLVHLISLAATGD
ncbi:hypothetical protein SSX86_004532 [Deinandra increscens subsp. villosa]|uniref:DNA polymerase alpha subunit B n=1 Tax=Deinandra increscens subsp. villosa TaxID=3103831 RepID=A0AAP0H7P4_9ASTR